MRNRAKDRYAWNVFFAVLRTKKSKKKPFLKKILCVSNKIVYERFHKNESLRAEIFAVSNPWHKVVLKEVWAQLRFWGRS